MTEKNRQPMCQRVGYAEIRVYDAEPPHDASNIYVMHACGVSLLIRRRPGGELYVHIDNEKLPRGSDLVVEVCSNGETDYVI